ncbi:energy-coupling factor transporter ATPase [Olsenella sp. An290]|uniref:ABC transporter ATP-binding protein n=1 Tax=Olsenella sp. An290 TaxID=1965625 RepID=UPI000B38D869|nr:energy-coupling factor transporter ATPase [Olsenella sp. An290]OUO32354.1 ABC transporter [Olsenella sp. An290]
MAKDALIRLSHVSLLYDGTPALDDVSLEVGRAERVCVLGANGSGKSTLASVVTGLLAPDAGTVELCGERVCADGAPDLEAYRRARRSLGLVFQNPDDQIVTSVVEDDVAFGPENLGLPRGEIAARVERELRRVALQGLAQADPTRLSGGQKQRVAIAGALAMEPSALVLDEPGSLLDVRGRGAIMRVMGRLAAAGTTLLHVTHFMEEALEADRVIVLDHGRIVLEGTPGEVFSHGARLAELGLEVPFAARLSQRLGLPWTCGEKDLVEELCSGAARPTAGAAAAATAPAAPPLSPAPARPRRPLVSVERASFSYDARGRALDGVTLEVAEGTSTAIVGQTGSGKSTLLRLLCGLEVPDEGRVLVAGFDTRTRHGRRGARRAVGYVMQHPERQLFAETVEKDVAFGPRNLHLPEAEVERRVTRALDLVGLSSRREASPFALSGGQRRLCALAGVLAMEPSVLILDEPTAGLDPRGRALLRSVLARLRELGVTLVQVTHSMEDAARAERVIVLNQARVLAQGRPSEVFAPEREKDLVAAGLGIPRSLRVARELERRGMPALGDPLTTDALVAALGRVRAAGGATAGSSATAGSAAAAGEGGDA